MELCKENLMRHIFRHERNIPGRSSTATAAKDVIRWARDIADALKYIHRQGIVHRDLKLENILVSSKLGVLVIVTIFNYNHLRPSRHSRTSSNSNSLAFTRFACFLRGIPVADQAINSLECRCSQIWKLAACLCFSMKLVEVGWATAHDILCCL